MISGFLGGVLVVGAGAVLIVLDKKSTMTTDATPTQATYNAPIPPTPAKVEVPDGEKNYDLFYEYLEGQFLCYQYEKEICFIKDDNFEEKFSYVIGNGGKQLKFDFEP